MLKLKEILQLENMVFSNTIKEKHNKKMKRELVHIHEPIISHNPPPDDGSKETLRELHWLLDYNDGKITRNVVMEGDDIKEVFEKYCDKNNLEYPKKYVTELIKDSAKIIYKLKYKYNRPRPFQLGEFYQIPDFKIHNLDTAKTPSYPSGHSTQGIFIGKALGKKYPNHKMEFYKLGKMISESRLMARAHYPSDTKFGENIGKLLFMNLK